MSIRNARATQVESLTMRFVSQRVIGRQHMQATACRAVQLTCQARHPLALLSCVAPLAWLRAPRPRCLRGRARPGLGRCAALRAVAPRLTRALTRLFGAGAHLCRRQGGRRAVRVRQERQERPGEVRSRVACAAAPLTRAAAQPRTQPRGSPRARDASAASRPSPPRPPPLHRAGGLRRGSRN